MYRYRVSQKNALSWFLGNNSTLEKSVQSNRIVPIT